MPATRQAVIPPDLLERVGRALYGEHWVAALARDLEMSRRSVEYMRDGGRGIRLGVVQELLGLVEARGAEVNSVSKLLRSAINRR